MVGDSVGSAVDEWIDGWWKACAASAELFVIHRVTATRDNSRPVVKVF